MFIGVHSLMLSFLACRHTLQCLLPFSCSHFSFFFSDLQVWATSLGSLCTYLPMLVTLQKATQRKTATHTAGPFTLGPFLSLLLKWWGCLLFTCSLTATNSWGPQHGQRTTSSPLQSLAFQVIATVIRGAAAPAPGPRSHPTPVMPLLWASRASTPSPPLRSPCTRWAATLSNRPGPPQPLITRITASSKFITVYPKIIRTLRTPTQPIAGPPQYETRWRKKRKTQTDRSMRVRKLK